MSDIAASSCPICASWTGHAPAIVAKAHETARDALLHTIGYLRTALDAGVVRIEADKIRQCPGETAPKGDGCQHVWYQDERGDAVCSKCKAEAEFAVPMLEILGIPCGDRAASERTKPIPTAPSPASEDIAGIVERIEKEEASKYKGAFDQLMHVVYTKCCRIEAGS